MLKNRKFLIVILLALIIATFSISNCFAATDSTTEANYYSVSYNDTEFTFPDQFVYNNYTLSLENCAYVIYYGSGTNILGLSVSLKAGNCSSISLLTSNRYICFYDSSGSELSCLTFYLKDGSWKYYGNTHVLPYNIDGNSKLTTVSKLYYSTSDIYNDNSVLVFQQTPLPQQVTGEEVTETITTTLLEELQKAEVLKEIQTTILGYLKYLIALVISVIAFWKGYHLLSTQLKKA